MDVPDTICDERLALTNILTERRWHLLNVLRSVKLVNLDDLDNILQQYCSLRSLHVLEEDYRRYCY